MWILALAAYAPMQRAEAATATCGTSTMNMYKSDGTAMPTSMTFEPREKQQSGRVRDWGGPMQHRDCLQTLLFRAALSPRA